MNASPLVISELDWLIGYLEGLALPVSGSRLVHPEHLLVALDRVRRIRERLA